MMGYIASVRCTNTVLTRAEPRSVKHNFLLGLKDYWHEEKRERGRGAKDRGRGQRAWCRAKSVTPSYMIECDPLVAVCVPQGFFLFFNGYESILNKKITVIYVNWPRTSRILTMTRWGVVITGTCMRVWFISPLMVLSKSRITSAMG